MRDLPYVVLFVYWDEYEGGRGHGSKDFATIEQANVVADFWYRQRHNGLLVLTCVGRHADPAVPLDVEASLSGPLQKVTVLEEIARAAA